MSNNIFYVYGLYDPNTKNIFYIGKGCFYRKNRHLQPKFWKNPKDTCNPFLYFKIQKLMNNDTPPDIKIIEENLSETDAYNLEHSLIKEYGRRFSEENGILFNISENKGGTKKGSKKIWSNEKRENCRLLGKKRRIYDPTYKELYKDYIIDKKTRKIIAKENNCSEVLIKLRLKELHITKPKECRYPEKNIFICVSCGKSVSVSKLRKQIYCSMKCYRKKSHE